MLSSNGHMIDNVLKFIIVLLTCTTSHITLTHHTQAQKELEQLEQEINPALDDNALVAFSFFLSKVVNAMATVPDVSQW